MKYQLQVTWKEITYEDLEVMEVTIQNNINKNNSILSLFGTIHGIIISIAGAFTGAFVGIAATSSNRMKLINQRF
ncbi:hypothetical protein ACFTQ7_08545 [Lysinibacillus sp. NPDC056959]|uniref:hypothetical protein n=1 Tax=Lysinibacillus sp. NPDC056959 TaxID=3345981 RepID=UPI00363A6F49